VATFLILMSQSVPATSPYTIRPTAYANGTQGFTNPTLAYDGNINSVAGASGLVRCYIDCLLPKTYETTWSGIPTGYSPDQLVIRWDGGGSFAFFGSGSSASVDGKIEYSLDAGSSWTTQVSFSLSSGNTTYPATDETIPLSPTQDPSRVRVRASLTVKMTSCPSPCSSSLSQASGNLRIADIRIEAGCEMPTGESSTALGWDTSLPTLTAAEFRGNLSGATGVSFAGRTVREESGGDGYDGCRNEAAELLSGTEWTVQSGNTYSPDKIGVGNDYISYYQQYGSLPCSNTETQHMAITCRATTDWVRYASNAVSYTVSASTFSVSRAGAPLSKSIP
jgi:hypothetical protein